MIPHGGSVVSSCPSIDDDTFALSLKTSLSLSIAALTVSWPVKSSKGELTVTRAISSCINSATKREEWSIEASMSADLSTLSIVFTF